MTFMTFLLLCGDIGEDSITFITFITLIESYITPHNTLSVINVINREEKI